MTRLRTLVVVGSACAAVLLLSGTPAEAAPDPASSSTITFPLPAAIAVAGALLLAVVMVVVLQRRRLAPGLAAVARLVARLGEPARRRSRLAERKKLGQWFASDGETVRRAYETLGHAAGAAQAVRLDDSGATIWVSPSDSVDQSWKQVDETRWHRPSTAHSTSPERRPEPSRPVDGCLVRVGSDETGAPVFVDLNRLDGVLSIVGDATVARDALQGLVGEVARLRRGVPLVVLRTAADLPIVLPAGLDMRPEPPVRARPADEAPTPVRGIAGRQPVRGLMIATGVPSQAQKDALLALCGRRGEGWTGVVCGDIGEGAHWRWDVDPDGAVEIPVLGVSLTVPA